MKLRLEVLDGARKGTRRVYDVDRVGIGRHPDADLQFDPEGDRAVSAYHAALARDEDGWYVRDLGSRNGTLVEGERIERDRRIRDGDTIRFGEGGPSVRVHLGHGGESPGPPAARDEEDSRTAVLRRKLGRKVRHLRLISLVLAGLLLAVLALIVSRDSREGARPSQQRRALQQTSDSVMTASPRAVDSLRGRAEGLRRALDESRSRLAALRAELAERDRAADSSAGGRRSRDELRRELQSVTAALRRQQLAAELDFAALEEGNWPALARIYVQRAGEPVVTATAFAVRSDALLATSRHVVMGDGDDRPDRIAVQFARSRQVWPARLVVASRRADLALVQARNVAGEVPTVQGLNLRPDTLAAGTPVALMGYPLSAPPPADGASSEHAPEPIVTGGLLVDRIQGTVRIRGYGEPGGSGSPILDARGQVVGILRGGTTNPAEGEQVLVGVPSTELDRLLSTVR